MDPEPAAGPLRRGQHRLGIGDGHRHRLLGDDEGHLRLGGRHDWLPVQRVRGGNDNQVELLPGQHLWEVRVGASADFPGNLFGAAGQGVGHRRHPRVSVPAEEPGVVGAEDATADNANLQLGRYHVLTFSLLPLPISPGTRNLNRHDAKVAKDTMFRSSRQRTRRPFKGPSEISSVFP